MCSYFDSMQIISQKKRSHQESADSSIRKLIYALCKTDNQFNALLIDKFKHLQKDIPEGSSLEQKVNILLNIESKHIILNGLRDALEDGLIFPGISDENYSSICDVIEQIRKLPIKIVPNRARQRSKGSKLIAIVNRAVRRILVTLGVVWLTEKSILAWIWNKIRENTVVSGGAVIIFFVAGGGIIISYKSGCINVEKMPSPPPQGPMASNPDRRLNICIRNLVITADHRSESSRNASLSNLARSSLPATLSLILDRHASNSKSLDDSGIDKNQIFPSMAGDFPYSGLIDKSKSAVIACAEGNDGRLPIDVNFSFIREKKGIVNNCNDGVPCKPSIYYLVSCEFAYKIVDPDHRYECPRPYDLGIVSNIPDIMPSLPLAANAPALNDTEEISSIFERCGGLFKVIVQLAGCRQKKPAS